MISWEDNHGDRKQQASSDYVGISDLICFEKIVYNTNMGIERRSCMKRAQANAKELLGDGKRETAKNANNWRRRTNVSAEVAAKVAVSSIK